ncbi:MAG: AbrB/MazE/SpoVT family DNA-binding domain-containing protein [Dehalococcoidia bacterium]
MSTRMTVTVDREGHLTLPETVRDALHLDEDTEFDLEIEDGGVILRPHTDGSSIVDHYDDSWAETPEYREHIRLALDDVRAGRVLRLSRAELEQMIADASTQ